VNPVAYHSPQDHLHLIEKIWKSEQMCSGGVGRGGLTKEKKYTPQVLRPDPGDRILIPRSVGELLVGGAPRRTKNIKSRLGTMAKSLSPVKGRGESDQKTKIFFVEGASNQKFSSVLAKIVENHRAKYS
jgi:hypothetical protein